MKPYLFIINPKSGTRNKEKLILAIPELFSENEFDMVYTEYAGHAREIACEAARQGQKTVVAIGGDGTINETAAGLVHSDTALAMIPTGSGNGFARHFKISMKPLQALKQIRTGTRRTIDTLMLDDRFFLNVGGMGFDARIAHAFADFGARGFLSYAKLVYRNFGGYKPLTYTLVFPEGVQTHSAFLVSFANASQYGNQAEIAPGNIVDDGLFETCILKPFPWYALPGLIFRTFTGRIRKSRYYESMIGPSLDVEVSSQIEMHIDGEPCLAGPKFTISVHAHSLIIIVPFHSQCRVGRGTPFVLE